MSSNYPLDSHPSRYIHRKSVKIKRGCHISLF